MIFDKRREHDHSGAVAANGIKFTFYVVEIFVGGLFSP